MNKKVALLLSFLMVLTVAAGCTSQKEEGAAPTPGGPEGRAGGLNETGYPIVDEPITLKLMGAKGPLQGNWEDMSFFREMEALTNIRFTFDTPPKANYDDKKNLIFASGDYPDLFFGGQLSTSDEVNYGSQGVLIPLEGLIEQYAPNVKRMLEEHPDVRRSITTADGHIYSLPKVSHVWRVLIWKMWINQPWMERVGAESPPQTTDELYALLKRFKENDANGNGVDDEIPMTSFISDPNGLNMGFDTILAAFGELRNGDGIAVKGDQVVFTALEPGYKAYLEFMNKLYAEGLIDSEFLVHTRQQAIAKGKEGRVGIFLSAAPYLDLDITPEESVHYPALPALTSPVNDQPIYPTASAITRGTFAITSSNPHPEATMRWVDYLFESEGVILSRMGTYEGDAWRWLDEEKKGWSRVVPEGKNPEEYRGTLTPDAGTAMPGMTDQAWEYAQVDVANDYLNQVTEAFVPVAKEAYPLVYFTNEEFQRLSPLLVDLKTYLRQMEAKFITGAEPLSHYDEFVQTIQRMKADEVVAIHQAAYDRWKSVD